MNYTDIDNKLQGRNRQRCKYANNTYLVRHDDYLAMQYHSTEVAKFYPNGDIVLDNGGWYTSTTKERMNWALYPEHTQLFQQLGVWYIRGHRYANNMTIKANGDITGCAEDTPRADKKLKAKVKKFAQLCANCIPLPMPNEGDCWYCVMSTEEGDSLGDALKDTSHLDSHVREGYVVPSLVFRALRESGNTDFILSLVFNNPDKHMLDIAQQRVQKSVYRYILRRKGYAI